MAARVEEYYERAMEFDDVTNIPFRSTVAEKAASELYGLRHLSIGKPSPDVEGPDQDGTNFKLSDYRGKVVLLYFWNEY